jgi:phosphatidylserine/phosphatidylglycerophosphate/cardiolipin synthase-like enzyme
MDSAHSVQRALRRRKGFRRLGTGRRALVNVVLTTDVFGVFVDEVIRLRPRRIEVVSPWLGDEPDLARVKALLEHAARFGAAVVLTTRTPHTEAHMAALDAFSDYPAARVVTNDHLHAKLYVCEDTRRRGVAVVGSANLSRGSERLDESAVVIRPMANSRVIRDLSRLAASVGGGSWNRRLAASTSERSPSE